MTEWWKLTAAEAQKKVLSGELTLQTYVESLLTRIEKRDPVVKAWVYIDADYVRSEAQRLDQIPPEERGILHGFVIGVKDVILTKDMPTAYNSAIFKNAPIQNVDANPILTLRASGGLLLGKTHTTEFAASMDGPPSRNPHNESRTPGGSSSGSGAAVGDYQVPCALGTQTMGSIVRPASYNGCYGFKPTWAAISREGIAMSSLTLHTFGFFSRCIGDMEKLADVFRLTDDTSPISSPFSLEGARIGFCQTSVWPKATPALDNVWAKAKQLLQQQGATIEDLSLSDDFSNIPESPQGDTWRRPHLVPRP